VTVSTIPDAVSRLTDMKLSPAKPATERRPVYEPTLGGMVEMPVHRRVDLASGATLDGPAVIVEDETTTIVPASFNVSINRRGDIVMEAKAHVQ